MTGFSRVRGETRPDVYVEVEYQTEARRASVSELEDDQRHVADFAELVEQLAAQARVLRTHGATFGAWRRLYGELGALSVHALESIGRRPGGRP